MPEIHFQWLYDFIPVRGAILFFLLTSEKLKSFFFFFFSDMEEFLQLLSPVIEAALVETCLTQLQGVGS